MIAASFGAGTDVSYRPEADIRKMIPFKLKSIAELSEIDFVEHPVWGCYYEPDEIDTLTEFGFDKQEIQLALRTVDYSDAYAFPLPIAAVGADFKYLYLSATFITPTGIRLVGYLTGPAIAVYYEGARYVFNHALPNYWQKTERELNMELTNGAVFPMECRVEADSRRFVIERPSFL